MIIIGIDPGAKTGGICSLSDLGIVLSLDIMPPLQELVCFIDYVETPRHCFIEKAQSFPKQGIASAFNYGDHFGQLQGILIALRIPYTLVAPGTWSKVMLSGTKEKDKPKDRNITAAQRLFPGVNLVADGCRKPHTGMVDALLIAEYGRRSLGPVRGLPVKDLLAVND